MPGTMKMFCIRMNNKSFNNYFFLVRGGGGGEWGLFHISNQGLGDTFGQ